MTIKDLIHDIRAKLAQSGATPSDSEIEFFLSHVMNLTRQQLWAHYNDKVEMHPEISSLIIDDFISRRLNGEPLQHILGCWDFYGYEFEVSSHVLVPRPETEGLVELVVDKLTNVPTPITGIEWGVGSGCISISLLKEIPNLQMIGTEVSTQAFNVAIQNTKKHGLTQRFDIHHIASLTKMESLPADIHFLVSNPPYVPTGEIEHLEVEVKNYDPIGALDGGESGLECYQSIICDLKSLKTLPSFIAFEIGMGQGHSLKTMFEESLPYHISVHQDLTERDRYVLGVL